jgi:DNA invertase Pin-like site-specific DNA recombinase
MKRVAIYIRVSTSKQDTDNQRRELEAVAKRSGWRVVKVYEDAGISGAKGRDQRPALDAMMKAVNAKEFDMVASWSVDRLGRSLTDLLSILQGLHDKGVGLFLHQQGLDTSTTAGKVASRSATSARARSSAPSSHGSVAPTRRTSSSSSTAVPSAPTAPIASSA